MKTFLAGVVLVLGLLLILDGGMSFRFSEGNTVVAIALAVSATSLAIYFLPAIVAMIRQHPAGVSILLLNLFLGWTLLGWVAALVWSAMPIPQERRLSLIERELVERRIAEQLSKRQPPYE